MLKKLGLPLFLLLFFAVTIPSFYFISSQSITITEKKVVYDLPYPGILPDHPLYFLKAARDKMLELTARDSIKKAETHLHLSDKKVNAAVFLAKKGKNSLAVDTLIKGQEHAMKIPELFKEAKSQGNGPTAALVERARLSNNKHRESIELLLKEIPQIDRKGVDRAIKLNEQVRRDLSGL